MFKEKYTQDNDRLTLPEEAKRKIRDGFSKHNAIRPARTAVNAALAVSLSLALAVGVVFAAANSKARPQTLTAEKTLVAELTYEDIYDTLDKMFKDRYSDSAVLGLDPADDAVVYTTESSTAIAEDSGINGGTTGTARKYSETNNQVEGVDEADIVKNDGRYIYTAKGNRIVITDSNGGSPVQVSSVKVTDYNSYIQDFYVLGNRIAVIINCYALGADSTVLSVISTDDKASPFVMAELTQSGSASQSRMVDGTVYLLSEYTLYDDSFEKDRPEEYIPCVNGKTVPAGDISLISESDQPTYLVITATNILIAQNTACESVLGGAENVYCDKDSLYYTFSEYNRPTEETNVYKSVTQIVKIGLSPEDMTTLATGKVEGVPLNQFSMDEYGGYLRIVTTVDVGTETRYGSGRNSVVSWSTESYNCLYVLDQKLTVAGSIKDLAPGERVESVRFDGDVGYFVTFRQIDPLFAADLSDPTAPVILSELKITGFSEYLHPYSDDLLFGFGMDGDEAGNITSLKLSMFDVSDPSKVTECHKIAVSGSYWSEASVNHKAIMVDAEKNIIAFVGDTDNGCRMYVYGYDPDTGFYLRTTLDMDGYFGHNARFVWIDEHFYFVTYHGINAFSLDTLEPTATLQFS